MKREKEYEYYIQDMNKCKGTEHAENQILIFFAIYKQERRAVLGDAQLYHQHALLPTLPSPLAPACSPAGPPQTPAQAQRGRGTTSSRQCVSFRLAPPRPAPCALVPPQTQSPLGGALIGQRLA